MGVQRTMQDIVIRTMLNREVDDLVRVALFIERIAVSSYFCATQGCQALTAGTFPGRVQHYGHPVRRQRQKAFLANFITMQELPT